MIRVPHPLSNHTFLTLFLLLWCTLVVVSCYIMQSNLLATIAYGYFSLVGVLGAIFANATGAGGGVIFIPMFNQLNFTEHQAIATSFAIQCFGMTAGAITWWRHYQQEKSQLILWQGFKRIVTFTSVASVCGLLLTQLLGWAPPASLHQSFSWFSLLLGACIIATVFWLTPSAQVSQVTWYDYIALVLIGLFGGAITAWLSVGVGELLAIYLILRRFDVIMAVACAVLVSAVTVWSAIPEHTLVNFNVYWQVAVFAGPGAILGGILAKTLVGYFSVTKLKLFFASWLLIIGAAGI